MAQIRKCRQKGFIRTRIIQMPANAGSAAPTNPTASSMQADTLERQRSIPLNLSDTIKHRHAAGNPVNSGYTPFSAAHLAARPAHMTNCGNSGRFIAIRARPKAPERARIKSRRNEPRDAMSPLKVMEERFKAHQHDAMESCKNLR